jgi:hypothetical protein
MSLSLGRTVSDGIRRVLTRTGAVLLAVMVVLQLLVQSAINTAVVDVFPAGPAGELEALLGLTLPVPGAVAVALLVVGLVLNGAYFVVLARALTRPRRELSTLPRSLVTRRLGRATLTALVGGVLVSLAVTVGLFLLVLPGIFLSICFLFFVFVVAVEDLGLVDALKRSWTLSRGHRLPLALLVILAAVVGALVGTVGSVLDLAGSPVVAELVSNALSSVLFVVFYGLVASAYLQVSDGGPDGAGGVGPTDPLGGMGAAD